MKNRSISYGEVDANATSESRVIKLFEVPFCACGINKILAEIEKGIEAGITQYISITNTESLYHALRIPSHRDYINNATFSCCDGVGVVIVGKMLGYEIPRLHGPDLMLKCCEYGVEKRWKHYFYGGKKGVPELLSRKLSKKFPGFITVGAYSPPFRELTPSEDKAIIEQINEASPDILWVGLGLLKQERWIADHLDKIKVPWMIGVGAAFDFHAGTVRRAPKPFRRAGLEWLYRVCFEPRMIRRNIFSFMVIKYALKEMIKERKWLIL